MSPCRRPARSLLEALQETARRVEGDAAMLGIDVGERNEGCDGRQVAAGRLGPLHEADGAVEVGLEVAPLRRRHAGEAVQVEVRDVDAAVVAVTDREGGARDRLRDAELTARSADEGRLAGAEVAGD